MKINQFRLVGATNVDLPVIGADPSGPFVLKGADGLGPPERDVFRAKTVQEGSRRQGGRARDRQAVFLVGLQPEWDVGQTAEELRTILYGLLTPPYDLPVVIQLMEDTTVVAQAQGDISKMEIGLFSKDPEVQITIDCDHPHFLAPAIVYQIPSEVVEATQTLFTVDNPGTAPSGFWMSIAFTSAVAGPIQIANDHPLGQRIDITGAWAAGDVLTIDTRPGSRGIWKTPSGSAVPASILNKMSGDSPWLTLHNGENTLRINNVAFDWKLPGFGHTPAYWGV